MGTYRKKDRTEYIYGNTARKLNSLPAREEMLPERRTPLTKEEFYELKSREEKGQGRRQAKKGNYVNVMSLTSLIVLSVSIILTLYVCVSYVNVQSEITRMDKEKARLESELVAIKDDNNTALAQINGTMDLTHIYKVATKELGMVHAGKNHIITYKKPKSNYSRKYAKIPEAESNLLENIMKK